MGKLTPYQRIVKNEKKGKGVVLTAEEVYLLTFDDAITTRAMLDDEAASGNANDEYIDAMGILRAEQGEKE